MRTLAASFVTALATAALILAGSGVAVAGDDHYECSDEDSVNVLTCVAILDLEDLDLDDTTTSSTSTSTAQS